MNEPLWVRGIDHHCAIDSFVNQIDATPINRTGTGKRACLRDPLTKPLQFFRWTQLGPGHAGGGRCGEYGEEGTRLELFLAGVAENAQSLVLIVTTEQDH